MECDFADTTPNKFMIMLMVGRVEGLACTDPVARIPIDVSGNTFYLAIIFILYLHLYKYDQILHDFSLLIPSLILTNYQNIALSVIL